jgi:hypothetical protein
MGASSSLSSPIGVADLLVLIPLEKQESSHGERGMGRKCPELVKDGVLDLYQ